MYYDQVIVNNEERASCKYCTISYKVPATSNMAAHTKQFHGREIKATNQSVLTKSEDQIAVTKVTTHIYIFNSI
jgi:hypothetical protein